MPKVTRKESAKPLQAFVTNVADQSYDGGAVSGSKSGNTQRKKKYAPESDVAASIEGNTEDNIAAKVDFRRVTVPQHRIAPLKSMWLELYEPITKQMKLDMRMNLKTRKVEIKTLAGVSNANGSISGSGSGLQRAADFVQAVVFGFSPRDAIALLRMDDLYIEKFEIKDVKTLKGEHLARCIGRIAGKDGKTKFTIENATKTRIVLADTHIHILGAFQNIRLARDSICSLILGSPASKVYTKLRTTCARLNDM